MTNLFKNYKNLRVFVTGHTGFKGTWLCLWLKSLGADVLGYSLEPYTNPAIFNSVQLDKQIQNVFGDILDTGKLEKTMKDFNPDIVFHLAAQPIVRLSYSEPLLTYQTNVIGTLNVLQAARKCPSVKAFVNITTDKCYENKETQNAYAEDDPMGGYDMYSSSKACVEIMSASFRNSFLQGGKPYSMATARAGNVIGGGDWALDRLVPDCIRFIQANKTIKIRNPIAIRPWQYVLEPLSGYLVLGQKLLVSGNKYAQGFNFGPEEESVLTVEDVAKKVVKCYGKGEIIVEKKDNLHEAKLLMLNINKAKEVLGWNPVLSIDEAIEKTVEWYKRFHSGENMLDFTVEQIETYEKARDNNEKIISKIC